MKMAIFQRSPAPSSLNNIMSDPFRVAVIATKYTKETHADVIVTRWLEPFPGDKELGWQPRTRIASMHVVQIPEDDISKALCEKHGVAHHDTVAGALTLGGSELAVDAILLIGEHGDYPLNEFGQKLYPRKELFDEIVAVFRKSERVVPLFFDKHLSWNMKWAHEMYWTIKDMGIPFFGGSSLSHTPRFPAVQLPETVADCPEILVIYWNSLEHYLFHSLEIADSILEQTGMDHCDVSSIVAWQEGGVWDALDREEFSGELLNAAAASVSPEAAGKIESFRQERGSPTCAFQIKYGNGRKITHFMQTDLIRKWCVALDLKNPDHIVGSYVDAGGRDRWFPHFGILDCLIEDFFLTGISPIPLERLYFSTMLTAACMQALSRPDTVFPTPWLKLPIEREWNGAPLSRGDG